MSEPILPVSLVLLDSSAAPALLLATNIYQVPATCRALVWALRTAVTNTGTDATLLERITPESFCYLSLRDTGMHQPEHVQGLAGSAPSHCLQVSGLPSICRRHSNAQVHM